MSVKKISVIMSVYKDSKEYFKAAVMSIQNQTYKNWEMIIINDGDTDNDGIYREVLETLSDERIKYISNKTNQGIGVCINQALKLATGEFIAKMDADDISLPTRFEKQVKFFDSHPESNVLGTYAVSFGDANDYLTDYNNYSRRMRSILLFFRNSGLIHPSAMLRRKFLDENKIRYDEHFPKALDYRLWVECTKYSKIDCVNEILFLYRRHFSQISTSGKGEQDYFRNQIRILQLYNLLDTFSEAEKELHLRLCDRNNNVSDIQHLYSWCKLLDKSNREKNIYDVFLFKGLLFSESLTAVCKLRKELSFKLFFKSFFQFISLESICVFVYNRCINVSNNIKQIAAPIFHRRKIRFIDAYLKQFT